MPTDASGRRLLGALLLAAVVGLLTGPSLSCNRAEQPETSPNVLWVLWDTVRVDHLSLYGYEKPTTPHLEEWARGARVFDNCTSPAPTTTPAHASMFTGLMPSEHGANDQQRYLSARFVTIAELLSQNGYQTYMYSANPNISRQENFDQGFDVEEHPWDRKYQRDAFRIVRRKIPPHDRSSELSGQIRGGRTSTWGIKATGELAEHGVESWLKQCDPQRPFFIFLNYMEAHRPCIPPESYRQRMMTPEQVKLSYQVDRSWVPWWAYTFRLHTYTDQQLAITAGTYDAALAELDDLLHNLLASLRASGHLRNTIVVVTADHGEHLGEHHMLDHQYSVYEPLVEVPLVIHYPQRFEPGRESRPVSTIDLFPTLLELAGVDSPEGLRSRAVSLLSPRDKRERLAEYPVHCSEVFESIRRAYPEWDPSPWQRSLRALFRDDYKYIWSSDGRHELYNIRADPRELNNLIHQAGLAKPLAVGLAEAVAGLRRPGEVESPQRVYSDIQLEVLKSLGYVAGDDEDEPAAASRPASAPVGETP